MGLNDILDIGGCIVRDENGVALAVLEAYSATKVKVKKMSNCSIGDYFYVMCYLIDLGFDVV